MSTAAISHINLHESWTAAPPAAQSLPAQMADAPATSTVPYCPPSQPGAV